MKFISFIASTILIVLINQYSITGLPINDNVVKVACSEGFENINGQCMPIDFTTVSNEIESSSFITINDDIESSSFSTVNDEIESSSFPTVNNDIESASSTVNDEIESSSFTTVNDDIESASSTVNDEIESSSFTTVNDEIESSSVHTEQMIIHKNEVVAKEIIPEKTGACPEGMEHGKHGICRQIQPAHATEVYDELTTELNENVGGVEDPKGCPEGTEHDEQGACQEIKPSKPTKIITDPKILLKKDGSCPDDYQMVDGRCLYIKTKTNSTLYSSSSTGDIPVSNGIRPKSGNDESSKVELVPVLSDNSCPEGTEYSEYGLCEKRASIPTSNNRLNVDESCPNNYELINGKCTFKNSKMQGRSGVTTTIRMTESITPAEEPINDDESSKSDTVKSPKYHSDKSSKSDIIESSESDIVKSPKSDHVESSESDIVKSPKSDTVETSDHELESETTPSL